MGIQTRNSLPIVSAYGINDVSMSTPSPPRGIAGNHLAPNEFGSMGRMPNRPTSYHEIGAYHRSSSTGDLLNSMRNLRT